MNPSPPCDFRDDGLSVPTFPSCCLRSFLFQSETSIHASTIPSVALAVTFTDSLCTNVRMLSCRCIWSFTLWGPSGSSIIARDAPTVLFASYACLILLGDVAGDPIDRHAGSSEEQASSKFPSIRWVRETIENGLPGNPYADLVIYLGIHRISNEWSACSSR